MSEINEKDYRRLEPGEIFQEGDRINNEPDFNTSGAVHFSIGLPLGDRFFGWRPIINLNPGDIIEWSGNEGFIIPNVFNTYGAVYIAWMTGGNAGKWTCHANVHIRQAIQEGKFKIKEELSDGED